MQCARVVDLLCWISRSLMMLSFQLTTLPMQIQNLLNKNVLKKRPGNKCWAQQTLCVCWGNSSDVCSCWVIRTKSPVLYLLLLVRSPDSYCLPQVNFLKHMELNWWKKWNVIDLSGLKNIILLEAFLLLPTRAKLPCPLDKRFGANPKSSSMAFYSVWRISRTT